MSAGIELIRDPGEAKSTAPVDHPLSLLIADGQPLVREGMLAVFSLQPSLQVVAAACTGPEAIDAFLERQPDLAVIDRCLPLVDGMDTIRLICERCPDARLIMSNSGDAEEDVYRSLKAGAKGYFVKTASTRELLECIVTVGAGECWMPPRIGAQLAKRLTARRLTEREEEVLRLVVLGKSDKEIGAELFISAATVKVHLTHLLKKLRVTSRAAAIHAALRLGIVGLS
jgi:DNA-binding NarL/FixJ family response regulator